jgi:hypothetical protein
MRAESMRKGRRLKAESEKLEVEDEGKSRKQKAEGAPEKLKLRKQKAEIGGRRTGGKAESRNGGKAESRKQKAEIGDGEGITAKHAKCAEEQAGG